MNTLTKQELLSQITEHYHKNLIHPKSKGRAYLRKRGLLDEEIIKKFKLGYSTSDCNKVFYQYRQQIKDELGLFNSQYYETFSNSLIFPTLDMKNNPQSLYARRLINYSHEKSTHNISKSETPKVVFNQDNCENQKIIYLTEGIIDALSIFKTGHKNVTSFYGKNEYTQAHHELFNNGRVEEVIFCFDNDIEGVKLVKTLKDKLSHLKLKKVDLQKTVKDINEQLVKHGIENLKRELRLTQEVKAENKAKKQIIISKKAEIKEQPSNNKKKSTLIEEIRQDIEDLGYLGEDKNKLLSYIAMTSRKMDNPLSVLIISGSGAGKSALQDTILSLCPEEETIKLTSISEKVLFYRESQSLKHKVLALSEQTGAENASYAIRNLISDKELIVESTIKEKETGRMIAVQSKVEGPTSVFKTTTNTTTDPETRSRFLILTVDESTEQTEKILKHQREEQTLEGYLKKLKRNEIIKKHHELQKSLKPIHVFNPYAKHLEYKSTKLWARRDHPKYLQIIKAITFLHQQQRQTKWIDKRTGQEVQKEKASSNPKPQTSDLLPYIEVTLEDIALANEIVDDIFTQTIDELSPSGRKLIEKIRENIKKKGEKNGDKEITRREMRELSGWGETYVREIVKELLRLDYLIKIKGNEKRQYIYELTEHETKPHTQFTDIETLKKKIKRTQSQNIECEG